ncbi:MAG: hypothetical protein AMXMBFR31_08880 [Candidatus Desulfobacillus denitrificans]
MECGGRPSGQAAVDLSADSRVRDLGSWRNPSGLLGIDPVKKRLFSQVDATPYPFHGTEFFKAVL